MKVKTNSKLLLFIILLIGFSQASQAQLWKKLKNKIEKKVEQKVGEKVDKEAEKILDKTLNGKNKKQNKSSKKNSKITTHKDSLKLKEPVLKSNTSITPTFKSYSKFDFISGEKIIAYEDFSQDEIGDLPARWNSTNSAEVVTIEGIDGKWMQLVKGAGAFVPDFIEEFPDNFTFEFDIIYNYDIAEYCLEREVSVIFSDVENPEYDLEKNAPGNNGFSFTIAGGVSYHGELRYKKYASDAKLNLSSKKRNQFLETDNKGRGKKMHVAVWRQKRRMRVYFNEEKVFDIPRAFSKKQTLKNVRFFSSITEENNNYYISNVRYAIGKPDVRGKLITEGKLVSYGITFDINSSLIKTSSYGTLKKIASVLKQNPKVKVLIVGHTDADGSADTNLILSKSRAKSVKDVLVTEFDVSENQLSYKGKGESELLNEGTSSESKAKNRRVEFIKQ